MILPNPTTCEGISMVRILIVEDDASLRQSLKDILHLQFPLMMIEEAAEGREAIRKVKTFFPNLIFMDIKLPGKSGLYLTKKIKKDHPEIIIVILTSYDSPEYRDVAFECGADRFIAKGALIWREIEALIRSISSDLDNRTSN
jgi:two-component system response regulator YesN